MNGLNAPIYIVLIYRHSIPELCKKMSEKQAFWVSRVISVEQEAN